MESTAVRKRLDLLLLQLVMGGASYGYDLRCQLRERSGGTFDIPEGSIYPALHRLDQGGFLTSRIVPVGRRHRRVYTLTDAGRLRLEAERRIWEEIRDAVDGVLTSVDRDLAVTPV